MISGIITDCNQAVKVVFVTIITLKVSLAVISCTHFPLRIILVNNDGDDNENQCLISKQMAYRYLYFVCFLTIKLFFIIYFIIILCQVQ